MGINSKLYRGLFASIHLMYVFDLVEISGALRVKIIYCSALEIPLPEDEVN